MLGFVVSLTFKKVNLRSKVNYKSVSGNIVYLLYTYPLVSGKCYIRSPLRPNASEKTFGANFPNGILKYSLLFQTRQAIKVVGVSKFQNIISILFLLIIDVVRLLSRLPLLPSKTNALSDYKLSFQMPLEKFYHFLLLLAFPCIQLLCLLHSFSFNLPHQPLTKAKSNCHQA